MPKQIVRVDKNQEVAVQQFVELTGGQIVNLTDSQQGGERLICIDGHFYRLYPTPNGTFYSMTKIGGHMQTVKGGYEDLVVKLAKIHVAWRRYEKKIQANKNNLSAERDQEIQEIASE